MHELRNPRATPGVEGLHRLRGRLRGPLLTPADEGYHAARRLWNGMIDKRPAAIARCTGVADVIEALRFAREGRLPVALRGGGHNVAGTASVDGGLVIDLGTMKGVRIDPGARRALAEPGVLWRELDRETQVFGLATPGGQVGQTGIAGLTLGGGVGFLRRRYGLSADNLLGADVVLADGRFVHASADEHADLFWALRGGGGSFGVVTAFEFALHAVGPQVADVVVIYPLAEAPRALRWYRDFVANASEEITADCLLWGVPDVDAFPQELRNAPVLIIAAVHSGPAQEGMRALQPLRELGTPLLDLSGAKPYVEAQTGFDPFFPDGRLYYWKSLYLRALDDATIDAVVETAEQRPSHSVLIALRHMGGAVSRVPESATAFGNRDAPFMLSLDATWDDPGASDAHVEWTRRRWRELQPLSTGGLYLNFAGLAEDRQELLRAGHQANLARLEELKRRYDPTNLLSAGLAIRT